MRDPADSAIDQTSLRLEVVLERIDKRLANIEEVLTVPLVTRMPAAHNFCPGCGSALDQSHHEWCPTTTTTYTD